MHQTGRKQVALLVARRVIYKILGLLSAASGFFWRKVHQQLLRGHKDPRWFFVAGFVALQAQGTARLPELAAARWGRAQGSCVCSGTELPESAG